MTILVLSPYPIENPRHGGQLRVHNIVKHYRNMGHVVEVAGVLTSMGYPQEDGFLPYPGDEVLMKICDPLHTLQDYATGKLFEEDDRYFSLLENKIKNIPHIIQVEHPWLFGFAKKYANKYKKIKIIYDSHNIEYIMKKEIYATYFGNDKALKIEQMLWDMERCSIQDADAVYCVSKSDLDFIEQNTSKPVLCVQNGVADWRHQPCDIEAAHEIARRQPFALFCGSGHPPNAEGFFRMFGGGFGSLSPEQNLVVVGGVYHLLKNDIRLKKSAKLEEKTIFAQEVSAPVLYGLLNLAHCFVLPITEGGGTNLKTAEALWSGKYIVATSKAMRGFEEFIGSEGVYIADDPGAFKRSLRHVMNLPELEITPEERMRRSKVLWTSCLSPITDFFKRNIEEGR